jgi:hypothetical protein
MVSAVIIAAVALPSWCVAEFMISAVIIIAVKLPLMLASGALRWEHGC